MINEKKNTSEIPLGVRFTNLKAYLSLSPAGGGSAVVQTSANNSTEYHYSEIIQKSAFIWGQIPGRIWVSNSTQVIF